MAYDVVIAGGGPVGLFLACELGLAGISVLVLERMEDPHSPLKESWMGMRGLNFPSVAAFYRRGMLKDVQHSSLAWMEPTKPGFEMRSENPSSTQRPRFAGHFAGIMLDVNKIDLSGQKYLTDGPSSAGALVSLEGIEEVLTKQAQKLGVEIRRGMPVTGFTQSEEHVTVQAGNEFFRANWLVGCDGGRSTVRKIAGFEFAGSDPEFTGYSAWVDMEDPEKLRPGFNLTLHGMYVNGPGPGAIGLIDFDNAAFDRTQEITLEDLQATLRRVSGTDVTIKKLHVATSYTDRARQATTYRKDRVLLAGDAAHIHSPLGGQGLNTGLGDAMNLGWKLAATIRGWAPEYLLDTYTAERHPVGAWALSWTRAQVSIMRPNPHSQAIAGVIRDLINTKDGTSYFVEKISGVLLRYDLPGEHPLIGRSAPDLEFEDGSRVGALLQDGTGLLLDLAGKEELSTLSRRWNGRLKYVSAKAKVNQGLAAILIRPDGFVAWASDAFPNLTVLEDTIHRWFGNPA
ncbi:MAG TPA: FAD-dependent monooxygenase [Edaphobacter sp.]|nr:FAD-dependent monooxygenase [Edaphobacter sp.]